MSSRHVPPAASKSTRASIFSTSESPLARWRTRTASRMMSSPPKARSVSSTSGSPARAVNVSAPATTSTVYGRRPCVIAVAPGAAPPAVPQIGPLRPPPHIHRQVHLPVAIAEEPAVANAVEARRQHVEQEASDELVGGQCHRFLLMAIARVLPAEAHVAVVDVEQAMVGDG